MQHAMTLNNVNVSKSVKIHQNLARFSPLFPFSKKFIIFSVPQPSRDGDGHPLQNLQLLRRPAIVGLQLLPSLEVGLSLTTSFSPWVPLGFFWGSLGLKGYIHMFLIWSLDVRFFQILDFGYIWLSILRYFDLWPEKSPMNLQRCLSFKHNPQSGSSFENVSVPRSKACSLVIFIVIICRRCNLASSCQFHGIISS